MLPVRQPPSFPLSLLFLTLCGIALAEADAGAWNQFRGLGGSGVALDTSAPVKLEQPVWKTLVAPGLSAPVIADGKVFLTSVRGSRLLTSAYEAVSGKLLWEQLAPEVPLEKVHAAASPASPTPLVADGRVMVYFGSFGLLCYDYAGVEQWRKPVPVPASSYGMAVSPIAWRENLILVLDNDENLPGSQLSQSKVIAVKMATGEVVWETPRPFVRSGWSTPAIWKHDAGEELVVLGAGRLTGYDPLTGMEKWFTTGFSRETIAVPVAGSGLLYASAAMLGGVADAQPDPAPFWKAMLYFDKDADGRIARTEISKYFTFPLRPELPAEHPGFGLPQPADPEKRKASQDRAFSGMDKDKDDFITEAELLSALSFRRGKPLLMAVRPGGSGDITESHIAWELNRSIPEIPSPLFHADRLYLVRSGGLLSCVNAADGAIIYTERLDAPGQYSASPVLANGHLYLISNPGKLTIVKAGDTYERVHQLDLGEPAFVTPAFDRNTIYIRTRDHLLAYRSFPLSIPEPSPVRPE